MHIDWDNNVGQERFLKFLSWWSFRRVERSPLPTNSVELLKQFGFVTYFLQLTESKYYQETLAYAQEEFIESEWKPEVS